jgi:purine-nucleoside phosphorylase
MSNSLNPFEFINAINTTKKDIMVDDITEKQYNSFMVNRSLSYFNDTVLMANEMNINHHLDNRLQFDFFINIVRKKKRFSKWIKPETFGDVEVVKAYYGYSNEKARQALSLLTKKQLDLLKKKVYKGGRK